MTEKSQEKPLFEYEIQTTHELKDGVYRATKIRIFGQFVEFEPYEFKKKGFEPSSNENGTVAILPVRVIKSIFKHNLTIEKTRRKSKQK